MVLSSSQSSINNEDLNNCINVDESCSKSSKSCFKKDKHLENSMTSSSNLDNQQSYDPEISLLDQNPNFDNSTYNKTHLNLASISNNLARQVKEKIENVNVDSRKRGFNFADETENTPKMIKKSKTDKRKLHPKLIKARVKSMTLKFSESEYYKYIDLKNSDFILSHFENLCNNCFSFCTCVDSYEFILLIADIFIYYRFTAIKNALRTKERVIPILEEISKFKDMYPTNPNVTTYILSSNKQLNKYYRGDFVIYPNTSSHRAYHSSHRDHFLKDKCNVLRNAMLGCLSELRKKIIFRLYEVVLNFLNTQCLKLNKEDKAAIRSRLFQPINLTHFESILDMGIRGINLEEDNEPFKKFYENLFIDQNGESFTFNGCYKDSEVYYIPQSMYF